MFGICIAYAGPETPPPGGRTPRPSRPNPVRSGIVRSPTATSTTGAGNTRGGTDRPNSEPLEIPRQVVNHHHSHRYGSRTDQGRLDQRRRLERIGRPLPGLVARTQPHAGREHPRPIRGTLVRDGSHHGDLLLAHVAAGHPRRRLPRAGISSCSTTADTVPFSSPGKPTKSSGSLPVFSPSPRTGTGAGNMPCIMPLRVTSTNVDEATSGP
jgi:hypothetical protein